MGMIKDNKKFTRKTKQNHPTNPEGIARKTTINEFSIGSDTIKEQQNKK